MSIRGREEMRRHLLVNIPRKLEKVLQGAVRAGGKVIQADAKARCVSSEVRAAIKLTVREPKGVKVTAKIQVKGEGAYIAPWLEYGTAPHFIRLKDEQRGGFSIGKINQKLGEAKASLMINGRYVGKKVDHPGATPHPFLRPALDASTDEAVAAAQAYIDRHTRKG